MAIFHEKSRTQFTVGGLNYKAIGFLKRNEESVSGDTMRQRTLLGDGIDITEEDEINICEHEDEIPSTLGGYCLATNRLRSRDGQSWEISYIRRLFDGKWRQRWYSFDYQWYDTDLVLRRLP